MSQPISLAQIQDWVSSTQREYGPPTFRQIAQLLTRFEIFSRWFREDKVIIEEGNGIERQLMLEHDDTEIHTTDYAEDSVDFGDVMGKIQVDFVLAKVGWQFHYNEIASNRGGAMLFDLIDTRRSEQLLRIANGIERRGWSAPASSSDTSLPWGVEFWCVKNSTRGFTGGLPSGHSTLAGIDLDEHTNFKNWANTYSDVSRTDLIFKMREARMETDFVSPLEVGGEGDVIMDTYRTYVNNETYLNLLMKQEDQNDNLGPDIGRSNAGALMFNGNPIVAVPYLNNDTSDPVYMLCHDVFKPIVQAGNFLRESEVIRSSKNSDVYVVFITLKYNYVCTDRRRLAVIYKA